MGILFESDSYIEILLKNELLKENLSFKEQCRLYNGRKYGQVKYVADFIITNKDIQLVVECDGFHFHAGAKNLLKQQKRDEWLKEQGYKVLHFSTRHIQTKMDSVIQTIKKELGLPFDKTKIIKQSNNLEKLNKKKKKTDKIDNFYDVLLFCFYKQTPLGVCVVYKYKSILHNKWSEERIKFCKSVPPDMVETTAIYMALIDLKKPVKIKVYYSGVVYHDNYDLSSKFEDNIKNLKKGNEILSTNEIKISRVGFYGDYRLSRKLTQRTLRELKSRCMQVSNNDEKLLAVYTVEYLNLCN